MKNITFVLPRPATRIVGGFKVVYEYANYLVKNGYDISIVYDCHEIGTRFSLNNNLIKRLWGRILYKQAKWFDLDRQIDVAFVGNSSQLKKIKSDLIIATAFNTVKIVEEASLPEKTRKAYFIQDFENWDIEDKYIYDTYKNSFTKIVVSRWLLDIVKDYSEDMNIFYCPNGIDDNVFFVDNKIEKRNAYTICFMYHEDERKGIKTLVPVINRLKNEYPQLIVNSFGAYEKPDFNDIDHYTAYATPKMLHDIYNNSAIFICSSYEEGFGLTGAESMACGCALVTTDTNGSREYANESNAMVCRARDENDMYLKIKYLLENNDVLHKLANKGASDIKKMTLEIAQQNFANIIKYIIDD